MARKLTRNETKRPVFDPIEEQVCFTDGARMARKRWCETLLRLYRDGDATVLNAVCHAIGTNIYRLDNMERIRAANEARRNASRMKLAKAETIEL